MDRFDRPVTAEQSGEPGVNQRPPTMHLPDVRVVAYRFEHAVTRTTPIHLIES